jgi:peptide/nickel transport system ATP-binding protein
MTLLQIKGLTVEYPTRFGTVTAISDVNLTLEHGQIHGLVGESGAGKSTVGAAVMGLIATPGRVAAGSIVMEGEELTRLSPTAWHGKRGKQLSMIFQDPLTSLDPLFTIEDQLVETIRQHKQIGFAEARSQAVELLESVGIAEAENRIGDYPHQFSGGMRQRAVIALAISTDPQLIIADEPTTALDVSVQAQILTLIRTMARERGIGVIFVTHDIGVIAEVTDRVSVMYRGRVVESGATELVLGMPRADYTKSLMAAVPRLGSRLHRFPVAGADLPASDSANDAGTAERWLLQSDQEAAAITSRDGDGPAGSGLLVNNLSVKFNGAGGLFGRRGAEVKALDKVSFDIKDGEVLGLVGESGSGKSTIAKVIVGLVRPSGGQVTYRDHDLCQGRTRVPASVRREVQMIFQDPYSSLNNRWRIGDIVAEPLRVYQMTTSRAQTRDVVASILDLVGVGRENMARYPHQFSGGQRQRVAIARALVTRPRLLICDEPTSALDVSIQAQILNLLKDLQDRLSLTILFISHNLPVVRQMADRLVVLKNGRIEEAGNAGEFFAEPSSAYGRDLLAQTPSLTLLGSLVGAS